MEKREIKFRAWAPVDKKMLHAPPFNGILITLSGEVGANHLAPNFPDHGWVKGEYELMQYTGLKDKSGVEIYEGDILQMIFPTGDEKEGWYTDGAFLVRPMNHEGFSLWFTRLLSDDPANQCPIHVSPNFKLGSLTVDFANGNYTQLAVAEKWGENLNSRLRWRETGYSNDIAVIGNRFEHPHLLNTEEQNDAEQRR